MNLLTREVHVQNADVIPDFCNKKQKKEADLKKSASFGFRNENYRE